MNLTFIGDKDIRGRRSIRDIYIFNNGTIKINEVTPAPIDFPELNPNSAEFSTSTQSEGSNPTPTEGPTFSKGSNPTPTEDPIITHPADSNSTISHENHSTDSNSTISHETRSADPDSTIHHQTPNANSSDHDNQKPTIHTETLHVDPYEISLLYTNIKDILATDTYNNTYLKSPGIIFRIVYSDNHFEACPPLLANKSGVTILATIEGLIAFARKEHTYYNWYSVAFSQFDDNGYSYFYDDDSIKIGDKVIVPVGPNNLERVGTVINFWRLSEERLPYPASKTKKIIRKAD